MQWVKESNANLTLDLSLEEWNPINIVLAKALSLGNDSSLSILGQIGMCAGSVYLYCKTLEPKLTPGVHMQGHFFLYALFSFPASLLPFFLPPSLTYPPPSSVYLSPLSPVSFPSSLLFACQFHHKSTQTLSTQQWNKSPSSPILSAKALMSQKNQPSPLGPFSS